MSFIYWIEPKPWIRRVREAEAFPPGWSFYWNAGAGAWLLSLVRSSGSGFLILTFWHEPTWLENGLPPIGSSVGLHTREGIW